eukprot:scaffold4120_cov400-Prasinococcus_capsulatus_cf.AAC.1
MSRHRHRVSASPELPLRLKLLVVCLQFGNSDKLLHARNPFLFYLGLGLLMWGAGSFVLDDETYFGLIQRIDGMWDGTTHPSTNRSQRLDAAACARHQAETGSHPY